MVRWQDISVFGGGNSSLLQGFMSLEIPHLWPLMARPSPHPIAAFIQFNDATWYLASPASPHPILLTCAHAARGSGPSPACPATPHLIRPVPVLPTGITGAVKLRVCSPKTHLYAPEVAYH